MTVEILGIKLNKIDLNGIIARLSGWLAEAGQKLVVTVNPEFMVMAGENPAFRAVLNNASLAIADGYGLILAGRLLRNEKLIRVTGVDLTLELLGNACPEAKIYLLGAAEGVADQVRAKFPQAKIVGAEAGGRLLPNGRLEDNEAVINRINESGANLLLVAFGQVKQEMWLSHNLSHITSIKVGIGIGGTLDYLAGLAKRAPAWLRAIGLEWLYRLIKEPRRWKRIWNATAVFTWLVLREKCKQIFNF